MLENNQIIGKKFFLSRETHWNFKIKLIKQREKGTGVGYATRMY